MTNRQARIIGTGLAMIAGGLMATVAGETRAMGQITFVVAAIFFAIDWYISLRRENL